MGKIKLKVSSTKLDTMETFHTEMGTIKHRNSMDLTEAENIKKNYTKQVLIKRTQVTMMVGSLI